MVKPPIVQVAGMHRARGRRVDTEAWSWLASLDGQRLFYPPNVAGWNDDRWLDTSSFRGRWMDANYVPCEPYALDTDDWTRRAAVRRRKARRPRARLLGRPDDDRVDPDDAARLRPDARSTTPTRPTSRTTYPVLIVNALRMLFAISPDYQTC